MKQINFSKDIFPHLLAVAIFFIVTVLFFNPLFFGNKTLDQYDINQWKAGAQQLEEYRNETGKEGLWAGSQFSGMPAYFVNLKWDDSIIGSMKSLLSLWLPHPVSNIFLAFMSFYILLLAFKVRPYLALGGALAFGLSSFMIIGLAAGHNARIGATALIPLVLAGVHLTFNGSRWLGMGLTALALSLNLRENHPQITYYLIIILGIYGIIVFIEALKQKQFKDFGIRAGLLVVAALLATGTYFGKFWSAYEYSQYSMRGKSEISGTLEKGENESGLKRDYAFQYSNGIMEPLTLMIPNIHGGSSSNLLVQDEDSEVLKALQRSGDQQMANQLARYTSAYWGEQPVTAPYYTGTIICFLFVIGLLFADRKYVLWLGIIAVIGIVLSWGDNFKGVNYLLFDHLPGYNKFRSVTFALTLALVAIPLLGMIGLEKLMDQGLNKKTRKKLLIALSSTGGLCLLIFIFAGVASFTREGESQLPAWFLNALVEDRKSLLRGDALRSMVFVALAAVLIFFHLRKKLSYVIMSLGLTFLILIDVWMVDLRYFTEDNYQRKANKSFFTANEADLEILKDRSNHRVYNLQGAWSEARTSYHHNSLGGYHGAKMRRYQDLYDHCLENETATLIQTLQGGGRDFSQFSVMNMLNAKYLTFGGSKNSYLQNNAALGNAWLIKNVQKVNDPTAELTTTCTINTLTTAVIDISKFPVSQESFDNTGQIRLVEYRPDYLKYEYQGNGRSFAVFSEIYYPEGWSATIDNEPIEISRVNYVLRALELPSGKHIIEFKFQPETYYVGNKVTFASGIILLVVVIGSIGFSIRKEFS